MKLLLDACVWGGACPVIAAAGHDVVWAGDWPEDPGDEEILARAHAENRIVVTLDKDFGEIAIVHGRPHSGIVRLVDWSAREQAAACVRALAAHGEELQASSAALHRRFSRVAVPESFSGVAIQRMAFGPPTKEPAAHFTPNQVRKCGHLDVADRAYAQPAIAAPEWTRSQRGRRRGRRLHASRPGCRVRICGSNKGTEATTTDFHRCSAPASAGRSAR